MNYLVQRGKVRGQVINVPEGLPELLSDITREVLRCQPTTECLCQFIIDYLHSIIVTREKARAAKSIIDQALRIVDEVISDLCICDIDKLKAEEMAAAMEECFRKFLEKRRCEHRQEKEIVKFYEEDMLDELIQRCKFSPQELKISRPAIEEAYNRFVNAYMQATEGTDGTEALYEYFRQREIKRIEDQLRDQAAIRIQSNFRGYLVRRELFGSKQKEDEGEPLLSFQLDYAQMNQEDISDLNDAARIIQRAFRKYTVVKRASKITKGEICSPKSSIHSGRSREIISPAAPEPVTEAEPEAEPGSRRETIEKPFETPVRETVPETEAIEELPPQTVIPEEEPEPEAIADTTASPPEEPAEEPPPPEPPVAEEPAPPPPEEPVAEEVPEPEPPAEPQAPPEAEEPPAEPAAEPPAPEQSEAPPAEQPEAEAEAPPAE